MRTKTKVIKYSLIYSLLILAAISINYQYQRFRKATPNIYGTQIDSGGIVIIGDSWVSHGKLDSLFPFPVKSFGFPGATSKRIYENLDSVIVRKPKYCIVIAGVNDRAQLMGADYYGYHMGLIVTDLEKNGITPIVVETADFFIEELYRGMNPISKSRNYITAYFNGSIGHTLEEYRGGVIHQVEFPELKRDQYKDPAHLNQEGSRILVRAICDQIETKLPQ